jgi:hypothetical protein
MPRKTKSKTAVQRQHGGARARKDVRAFRESLWKTLERNCEGLSAADVIRALYRVTEDIYYAGIDEAYTRTRVQDPRNVAEAWDLTWVTALSVALRQRQEALGKAPLVKTPRRASRPARARL